MEITVETSNNSNISHINITTGTSELKTHPCYLPIFSKTVGTCNYRITTKMLSKTLDNNNNNSSMKAETEASQTRHKRNHI